MRILRVVLTVVAFVGVIALVLIGALYGLVTPERVQNRLTLALEENLGLSLRLSAPPSVHPLPDFRVTLPAAEVVRTDSAVPVARWDSAVLELNPFAVFTPSPRVRRLTIEGFVTDIGTLANTSLPAEGGAREWNIDEIRLNAGRICFADADGAPTLITDISGVLIDASEAGARGSLSGTLASNPAQGAVTIEGALDWSTGLRTFSVESPRASFDGLIDKRQTKGTVWASQVLIRPDGASFAAPRLEAETETIKHLSASAESLVLPGRGTYVARTLSTKIDLERREGSLTLHLEAPALEKQVDGRLLTEHFTLASRLVPPSAENAPLEGRLSGSVQTDHVSAAGLFLGMPVTFQGAFLVASNSADPHVPDLAVTGDLTLGKIPTALLECVRWVPELLTDVHYEGTFRLSEGALKGFPKGLAGNLLLEDGALSVGPARGECLGGALDLAARLDADGTWDLAARIRDANAEFGFPGEGTPLVTGRLHGELSAAGNLKEGLSRLAAEGRVIQGALGGVDLPMARSILLEDQPEAVPGAVLGEARTPFDELTWRLVRETDGTLRLAAHMQAPGLEGRFSGNGSALPASLHADFLFDADAKLSALPMAADVTVEPNGSARWSLDWSNALERVRDETGDVPFSFEHLKRNVERSVRDFWNGIEWPDWTLPKMPWASPSEDTL